MTAPRAREPLRPSTAALSLIVGLIIAFVFALSHAALSGETANERLDRAAHLAGALGLSDLALFTEARYTRHPAMADLHTPFQDHPVSFDHFPSDMFVPPKVLPGSGRMVILNEEGAE